MMRAATVSALLLCSLGSIVQVQDAAAQDRTFPGTAPLEWEEDIASRLVAGADTFLLRKLQESVAGREDHWRRDLSSPENYTKSVEPNRARLAHIIGLRDQRVTFAAPELLATIDHSAVVGRGKGYTIYAVRWPAFRDVHGEGLLLVPQGKPVANVVAIPDADQTPEQITGLAPAEGGSAYALRLVEGGCQVLIPTLMDRALAQRRRALLTNREFVYRSAFELGRHMIGYEVQKVLAGVDWFARSGGGASIGVVGWGEGGLLALYASAVDQRIDVACVSGYFDSRQNVWQEPLDRNVFGLLEQFGDAELASLVAPRQLIVEAARGPQATLPSNGGGPGRLLTPELSVVRREVERARGLTSGLTSIELIVSGEGNGPYLTDETLSRVLDTLAGAKLPAPSGRPTPGEHVVDATARQARQLHELDVHNQWLLSESAYVRQEFMKPLDTSSLEKFEASVEPFRRQFRHEVIGAFDQKLQAPKPRTRVAYDKATWTGYEVVLDVFPDVFAYGILLWPKGMEPGERRPVVVCQHGLEGRPQDVVTGDHRAYHDFAAKLAERGFITFAPQNIYIFKDRFRTLQRKANPIKKTLFSIMVPQHQQIVDWLSSLPNVDPQRIAFYGLSYGGKSAMRIPPLVDNYCLSICSADFNEWVWKNASSRARHSYVWTGEYEIFEFDLGSTFNYAEMATLIAPRPFMVERGHYDGVAPDETVAYEFAKVRHLYAARLGIPDRCAIEWFYGPYKGVHTINGQGTFDFLHKHLNWPKPD